jgi:hypothetical protein
LVSDTDLSAQLAVFTAPSIDSAQVTLFKIQDFLTGYAVAHTWHGLPARLRNGHPAFFTMTQTCALWQAAARKLYGVIDTGVDLILHRSIAAPAPGHGSCCPTVAQGSFRNDDV